MAQGVLKNILPPGNNGTAMGTGEISGDDGKNYSFSTPSANNNQRLEVHKPVTFTLDNGVVTSVTQDD